MIVLPRPWFLLLLLFAVPVLWAHVRSFVSLPAWRCRTSLALRLLIIVIIALAAAGLLWKRSGLEKCVVFLVDESLSVDPRATETAWRAIDAAVRELPAGDQYAIVAFGGRAQIVKAPGQIGRAHV